MTAVAIGPGVGLAAPHLYVPATEWVTIPPGRALPDPTPLVTIAPHRGSRRGRRCAMRPTEAWNGRLLAIGFWSLNAGLFAMVVFRVLPIGPIQTWASVEHGYAYARSPELMQTPIMTTLRWMRIPGDTLFALGTFAIVSFIFGVGRGHPRERERRDAHTLPSVPPTSGGAAAAAR